jgi:DNA polymerase III subunit delta'
VKLRSCCVASLPGPSTGDERSLFVGTGSMKNGSRQMGVASVKDKTEGFGSFVGNAEAIAVVRSFLASRRIPHALLFTGPEGVGKKTLAIMFAKALNCGRLRDDFCGVCAACRRGEEMLDATRRDLEIRRNSNDAIKRVQRFTYFDLQLIEPLTRHILIEQIRELRNVAYSSPFELRGRVFIIDQAQAIHWQATDLLLKLLEEPPETTTLVLVCPNRAELRATIRSRCHIMRFSALDESTIMKVLAEDSRIPLAQQPLVARLAAGSVGRAKEFNFEDFQRKRQSWLQFLSSLLNDGAVRGDSANWRLLFDSTRSLTENRAEFHEMLNIGYSLLSDMLRVYEGMADSEVTNIDAVASLKQWAPRLRLKGIEALTRGLDQAYRLYSRNINLRLHFDALAVELHAIVGTW